MFVRVSVEISGLEKILIQSGSTHDPGSSEMKLCPMYSVAIGFMQFGGARLGVRTSTGDLHLSTGRDLVFCQTAQALHPCLISKSNQEETVIAGLVWTRRGSPHGTSHLSVESEDQFALAGPGSPMGDQQWPSLILDERWLAYHGLELTQKEVGPLPVVLNGTASPS
ncbi:hypothetical protein B0I35DRAFT_405304 [Stachybotrys elegans]|uniref:Uncharacterized protein n=1 Tax=Stachybotrys elegans TaxID=80388 RepID=A0A8K0SYZ4_9HYPO|nr:hypothetical protein B0I35DRAFT_405304 [Stachybotrys elegans]